MTDNLITPQQLADHLGVPLRTVYKWNAEGTGPNYVRAGKHVRYEVSEVERWKDEHRVRPAA